VAEAQAAIATVQGHRSAVYIDISAIIAQELAEVQSAIAVDEGQRSAGNIDTSAIIAHQQAKAQTAIAQDRVFSYSGMGIVCSHAPALGAPLLHVATKIPLSIVCLGWQVRVGSAVDLLISRVGASGSDQAVCVLGSECDR
jgi:hypothetical protein